MKFSVKINQYSVYSDTQKNSKTLPPMGGIFCYCILIYLGWTQHNEINMHFSGTEKQNEI